MNLKALVKNTNSRIKKTTKTPTLKQYLRLEDWAFINNFYVHPEYIKAVKIKEKLIVVATLTGTVLLVAALKIIVLILTLV